MQAGIRYLLNQAADEGHVYLPGGRQKPGRPGLLELAKEILDINAELIAPGDPPAGAYGLGERIFHQKFGYGHIVAIDGNKLAVDFDKAGRKKILDSFVERHG